MIKYYLLLLISLAFFISCSESITDNKIADKAPDTFLFLYPQDGTDLNQQKSKITIHWWSDDPDGLVIGYIFMWEGIETKWNFTTKNDSTFSLPIGTADTSYQFKVASIDNMGNGVYDEHVYYNNVDIGGEPYVDANNNGSYDVGELYTDFGNIDPTPAILKFPIKNTAPVVIWTKTTVLPTVSYPVMTLAWEATDLDGDESIIGINIALNDTNNFITLKGGTRLVTLRCTNFDNADPVMDILVNGLEANLFSEKLSGIKLDDNNHIYVQAVDISGAKSSFISLPEEGSSWFIKKPKGRLLVIDDYTSGSSASSFYTNLFANIHSGAIATKYDELDMENVKLPYQSITFLETMKLFKYVYWYTDSSPSMDLAAITTQKFIQAGGKIAFSMVFQDSTENFPFEKSYIQNFLPIDSLGQKKPLSFLQANASILAVENQNYPLLKTSAAITWVRTYAPNASSAYKIYDLSSTQINGNIAFMDVTKTLFFIGLPLHLCDGQAGSVQQLLDKVFFDDFGYSL